MQKSSVARPFFLQGPSRQGQGMCKRSAQIPGGWGMSERSDEIPVSTIGSFLRCRQKTGRNFGVAVQKLLIFCFSSCCRKENGYFFCDSGLQIPVRETCLVQIVRYSARIAADKYGDRAASCFWWLSVLIEIGQLAQQKGSPSVRSIGALVE